MRQVKIIISKKQAASRIVLSTALLMFQKKKKAHMRNNDFVNVKAKYYLRDNLLMWVYINLEWIIQYISGSLNEN
jgi:hypothetical protein